MSNKNCPPVIGLWSPAMGSGKSTVAAMLFSHYGYQLVSFAEPLKKMIETLLLTAGFDYYRVDEMIRFGRKEEPVPELGGVTPRRLMQTLGTEWGRETVYPNLWVDIWEARVSKILKEGGRVVVDDVRFWNEASVIKEMGGSVVEVYRPGAKVSEEHASEGSLRDYPFDKRVLNDSSVEELSNRVDSLISAL